MQPFYNFLNNFLVILSEATIFCGRPEQSRRPRWQGFAIRWQGSAARHPEGGRLARPRIPSLRILGFAIPFLLLLSCQPGRHERMRQELAALQAMNQADSLLTNDSLAQALADWFDRHGTPNEQMEAHYLLGRTHADRGEAPAALAAYHDAADRADTTAANCNYRILARIHAQSAQVFRQLVQTRSQMEELQLAGHFASKAGDTLLAIECYAQRGNAYKLLGMGDSAVIIYEKAANMYESVGHTKRASILLSGAVTPLIEKGQLLKAKHYINIYEAKSGLLDENGNISRGREIYYYIKGRYYMAVNNVDSAEYMFRKLARYGCSLNDRIAAYKGLQSVYEERAISDSLAKYSNLGYLLNDSAYSLSEMENIQRMKATYNYERNRLIAQKAKEEARNARYTLTIFSLFAVLTLLAVIILFMLRDKKKQKELHKKQKLLEDLQTAQTRLQEIYNRDSTNYTDTVDKLKNKINGLQHQITIKEREKVRSRSSVEKVLDEAEIVCKLKKLLICNPPGMVSEKDFNELKNLINTEIPTFYNEMNPPHCILRPNEYEICILIRLKFRPADICKLTGVKEAYISNLRKRILRKLYGIEGQPRDLDARILETY